MLVITYQQVFSHWYSGRTYQITTTSKILPEFQIEVAVSNYFEKLTLLAGFILKINALKYFPNVKWMELIKIDYYNFVLVLEIEGTTIIASSNFDILASIFC